MSNIDSIDLGRINGFDIRAELFPDENAVADSETYSPQILDAFEEGVCQLVQMIVIASRAGVDLGSDSLWNVEYGVFPHDSTNWQSCDPLRDTDGYSVERRQDLIDNAIADANMKLSELADAATTSQPEQASAIASAAPGSSAAQTAPRRKPAPRAAVARTRPAAAAATPNTPSTRSRDRKTHI